MTMPVMEPDLDAATLRAWARAIDEGPFASACFGERVAFDNPETVTLLGALAAWTDRVRLVTTVIVPQLHDPVMLAKALATGDMLSGGRLTVGLGVGGRHEDYRAVGADPVTQTMRGMAERAAAMKRVWAGERLAESICPVGPSAVQDGRPELLVGTMGPKTVRSAANWANGLAGTTLDLDVDAVSALFDVAQKCMGGGGQAATAPDDVVLVRARAGCARTGARAFASLHELDSRRVRRRDCPVHGLRRQSGRIAHCATQIRRHRHGRGASDPDE